MDLSVSTGHESRKGTMTVEKKKVMKKVGGAWKNTHDIQVEE